LPLRSDWKVVGEEVMVCETRSSIAVGARCGKITHFEEKNEFWATKLLISTQDLSKRRFLILEVVILSNSRT
jgi:hypothetical protein